MVDAVPVHPDEEFALFDPTLQGRSSFGGEDEAPPMVFPGAPRPPVRVGDGGGGKGVGVDVDDHGKGDRFRSFGGGIYGVAPVLSMGFRSRRC